MNTRIWLIPQIIALILLSSAIALVATWYWNLSAYWAILTNVLILTLSLTVLIRASILKPLRKILETTRKMAQGDFTARTESRSYGEILEIEQSINEMAVALETSIQVTDNLISNLKEAVAVTQKASQAKSIFLANVSHELRTPMHGILSYARFGQQKAMSTEKEKLKTYFDEIYDCGFRLMSLLNDLLDLSKLEAGKQDYVMKENNFTKIVEVVVSEANALANEKGIKFAVAKRESPVHSIFDHERIMQVLRNVVNNAVKFSLRDTEIEIEFEEAQDKLVCKVINSGPGIPSDELEAIFDKFAQSSKTRTGAGGTGLGLAICKEIVEYHGGKIWAENQPKNKTAFIFELPKQPPRSAVGEDVHKATA